MAKRHKISAEHIAKKSTKKSRKSARKVLHSKKAVVRK